MNDTVPAAVAPEPVIPEVSAAAATDTTPTTALDRLAKYYEQAEAPQVDNSEEAEQVPKPPPMEPLNEEPKEEEIKEPEAEEEAEEEPPEIEYLDAEGLEAKFPRQFSKASKAYTTALAADAKAKAEVIETQNETFQSIGGEHYVPAYQEIHKAAQGNGNVFVGLAQISDEVFLGTVSDSLVMTMLNADAMAEDPESADLGKALQNARDIAIKEYFGVSREEILNLLPFAKDGWPEFLEKSIEAGEVDEEEFDKRIQLHADPEKREMARRLREFEGKSEKKPAAPAAKPAERGQEIDDAYLQTVGESIQGVLDAQTLKSSVLRDHEKDSDELKTEKKVLRTMLAETVKSRFKGNGLQTSFGRGEAGTAKFKSEMATAVEDAITLSAEDKTVLENIVKKLYGKTRNTSLVPKPKTETAPAAPTVPPPAEDKPRTKEEMTARLAAAYETP